MKLHNYLATINEVITDSKKVGTLPKTWDSMLDAFIRNIDAINALPRDAKRYNDTPLGDIAIPAALKSFIAPNSVTMTGDIADKDLLVRESDVTPTEVWDENDFQRFCHVFATITKKEEAAVSLTSLRNDEAISSSNRCNYATTNQEMMSNWTRGIIPFEITVQIGQDDYYTDNVNHVVAVTLSKLMD